jgi:hypothetical protein
LAEAPRGQWFIPGDRISFMLTFIHEMNVVEVRAVFANAQGARIVLSGSPALDEQHGIHKFSSVELAGEAGSDASPGEYRCEGLLLKSFGGRNVSFEEVPDMRFVLVDEPVSPPAIRGIPVIRAINRWKKAP